QGDVPRDSRRPREPDGPRRRNHGTAGLARGPVGPVRDDARDADSPSGPGAGTPGLAPRRSGAADRPSGNTARGRGLTLADVFREVSAALEGLAPGARFKLRR